MPLAEHIENVTSNNTLPGIKYCLVFSCRTKDILSESRSKVHVCLLLHSTPVFDVFQGMTRLPCRLGTADTTALDVDVQRRRK